MRSIRPGVGHCRRAGETRAAASDPADGTAKHIPDIQRPSGVIWPFYGGASDSCKSQEIRRFHPTAYRGDFNLACQSDQSQLGNVSVIT